MKGNSVQFKVPHFKSWSTITGNSGLKKPWSKFQSSQATDVRSLNDYINTQQNNISTNSVFANLFSCFNSLLSFTDFY